MSYKVQESDNFSTSLGDAAFWLFSHNLETSEEFATRKFLELEQEVNDLKNHLRKTGSTRLFVFTLFQTWPRIGF
jgi:hypothetical protein